MLEVIREQSGDGGVGVHAGGLAAVEFGADRIEVHEPAFEDRPRHRFQRLVHPPVQFDLVVQRAENVRDRSLFGQRGRGDRQRFEEWNPKIADS